MPKLIHAVCERIRHNLLQKQKRLAKEIKVSKRFMSRILQDNLRLGAYQRCVGHLLGGRL